MSHLREYLAALGTCLLCALERPRHLVLIAAGFLIAAATVLVLLTLPAGLDKLAGHTGSNDILVVLPAQSIDEGSHKFATGQVRKIATLPGVARDAQGHPMVAAQYVAYAKLRRADGQHGTVLIRGVTPTFYQLLGPEMRVTAGHRPRTGHNELMAGSATAAAYVALKPGDRIRIHGTVMQSAGTFRAGAGFWNSEIWMSRDTLQSLYHAPSAATTIWVELTSPDQYTTFLQALHADKSLAGVSVQRQTRFYARQTRFLGHFVHMATVSVALVLGLGALLAITNALSIALDARRHQLAILRAMGFRRGPLAWALMTEVWFLGLICVGIAALFAGIFWNGHAIDSSTLFTAVRFQASISPEVIMLTLAYILLLGTLSALTPICRVVRAPLVDALRNV